MLGHKNIVVFRQEYSSFKTLPNYKTSLKILSAGKIEQNIIVLLECKLT